jgi:hypothetical protein
MRDIERQMRALLDRQQIYEVLTRYCRGVDRGDVELIRSVYHADATDDHGMFKGLGVDFASWIVEFLKEWKQCQHFIGNFNCNLQGDVAHTETYCLSISDDGQGHNSAVYNRYIDRFERRNGEWKIAERLVVLDVSRVDPVTESFDSVPGWNFAWGQRNKNDPSYAASAAGTRAATANRACDPTPSES